MSFKEFLNENKPLTEEEIQNLDESIAGILKVIEQAGLAWNSINPVSVGYKIVFKNKEDAEEAQSLAGSKTKLSGKTLQINFG